MVRLFGDVSTISHIGIHNATAILNRHLYPNIVSRIGVEVRSVLREVRSPLIPIISHITKEVSHSFNLFNMFVIGLKIRMLRNYHCPMNVDSIPTIPHLIEEVPDFKDFIASSFVDGDDILVRHSKPHKIKFYLDSTGCSVMKYKLLCTDVDWLGEGGRGIKLWKEDAKG